MASTVAFKPFTMPDKLHKQSSVPVFSTQRFSAKSLVFSAVVIS